MAIDEPDRSGSYLSASPSLPDLPPENKRYAYAEVNDVSPSMVQKKLSTHNNDPIRAMREAAIAHYTPNTLEGVTRFRGRVLRVMEDDDPANPPPGDWFFNLKNSLFGAEKKKGLKRYKCEINSITSMCPDPLEYDYGSENMSPRAKNIIDLFYPVVRAANPAIAAQDIFPNGEVEIVFGNKVNQTDPIIVGVVSPGPKTSGGPTNKNPGGPCGGLFGSFASGAALTPGQRDRLSTVLRGESQEVHWPPVPIDKNMIVTSYYGARRPPKVKSTDPKHKDGPRYDIANNGKKYLVQAGYKLGSANHNGWDIRANIDTPVKSPYAGKIVRQEDGPRSTPNEGNLIYVEHDIGDEKYRTFYCHGNRHVSGLNNGDTVAAGDIIMYSGNTGRSTGPHLHFGAKKYRKSGKWKGQFRWIDPKVFMKILLNSITSNPATDGKTSSDGDNPSEQYKSFLPSESFLPPEDFVNNEKKNKSAKDSTSGSPTPAIAGKNRCVAGQVGSSVKDKEAAGWAEEALDKVDEMMDWNPGYKFGRMVQKALWEAVFDDD